MMREGEREREEGRDEEMRREIRSDAQCVNESEKSPFR
jgi:hypothetical protein